MFQNFWIKLYEAKKQIFTVSRYVPFLQKGRRKKKCDKCVQSVEDAKKVVSAQLIHLLSVTPWSWI